MKNQQALSRSNRRLVSSLFFGGLILMAPQLMADKPTMSQTSSGSSAAASSGSGSDSSAAPSASSSRSRSSRSPRGTSAGRARSSQPAARTPVRGDVNNTPSRRGDVRRNRTSSSPPAASYDRASGDRYRGDRGSHHGGRYGYGSHNYHYHYPGCGHGGYGYGGSYYGYGFGYPYYYGPFGYIYYRQPHVSIYSGGYDQEMGALDLDVRPEKAQIFVDGTLVGVADQYDGFPAYLWLEKGTYDIVIYKEGYETIFRQYTVYPGVVLDVSDQMVRGTAVKPEDLYAKSTERREERLRRNEERRAASRQAAAQERVGSQVEVHQQTGSSAEQGVGRLLLSIIPGDAAVYLDGHFLGTAAELGQLSAGLVVEPGDHMLEAVRPGFETQRVPIQIPAGDRISIDLELSAR